LVNLDRLIYPIINFILVSRKGVTIFLLGKRKKQGLGFQNRHPKIIIIIKKKRPHKWTILLAKPICPSNQSTHKPI
jgi:hypothetical protein